MGSPWFHDELIRRITKERSDRAESLATGLCGDFPDYRYAVGFCAGMQFALEIADEIKREQDQQ